MPDFEIPTSARQSKSDAATRLEREDVKARAHSFSVDPALAGALHGLATQHDATTCMTLLAAFNVLLMRYTGQHDIAVGVTSESVAHAVVMRNHLDPQAGFIALLERVRETMRAAFGHREPGSHPHFRVLFSLEGGGRPGVAGESTEGETSPCDLSLSVTEADDGFEGSFAYRIDLVEPRTIAGMAEHFVNLLAGIVADPHLALDRLPLMNAAERHRVLVEWNERLPATPRDLPVQALFRAQAQATPGAIALRSGHRMLSYRDLDLLSDRLAHELTAMGVGAGVAVGISMRRCIGAAVGLLAVFKAGGVYLPLDPEHPNERLQAMLDDAAPAVVLTQAGLADRLPRVDGVAAFELLVVPDDGGELPAEPLAGLPDATDQDQLAYLIYTSGSTGVPKAAQLMHRGLSNHVLWINDALGLTAQDQVLQKTSASFDASLWEFFSPLCCGATLVIAPPDAHLDMRALTMLIRDDNISVIQFVPSELRVWLGELAVTDLPRLRYVLSGGEAMDRTLASTFRQRLPEVRLGNFYGPTEATVDSAWYEIGEQLPDRPTVPIGRPIANAQLYILDAWHQPQPPHVAGELYVGGLGVARGYHNRPELSADRFAPNPFRAGESMYRTGDLARWLHDGVVEFIGRRDDQVKLRGFRIELGEIESALSACDTVRMNAVLMREVTPGRNELVAYVVPNGTVDGPSLRAALRSRLPAHMIPTTFVIAPELPRLTSGKIDRNALPAPHGDLRPIARTASAADAPSTPAELAMADIWRELLGVGGEAIERSDNFFDLGGDSLQASRAVVAFHHRSGVRLEPNRMVFESLAQLARGIELRPNEALLSAEVPQEKKAGWLKRLFMRGWIGSGRRA